MACQSSNSSTIRVTRSQQGKAMTAATDKDALVVADFTKDGQWDMLVAKQVDILDEELSGEVENLVHLFTQKCLNLEKHAYDSEPVKYLDSLLSMPNVPDAYRESLLSLKLAYQQHVLGKVTWVRSRVSKIVRSFDMTSFSQELVVPVDLRSRMKQAVNMKPPTMETVHSTKKKGKQTPLVTESEGEDTVHMAKALKCRARGKMTLLETSDDADGDREDEMSSAEIAPVVGPRKMSDVACGNCTHPSLNLPTETPVHHSMAHQYHPQGLMYPTLQYQHVSPQGPSAHWSYPQPQPFQGYGYNEAHHPPLRAQVVPANQLSGSNTIDEKNKIKLYCCTENKCSRIFFSFDDVMKHSGIVGHNSKYICNSCAKCFSCETYLRAHKQCKNQHQYDIKNVFVISKETSSKLNICSKSVLLLLPPGNILHTKIY